MKHYTIEIVCDAPCDKRVTYNPMHGDPDGWERIRIGERDFDLCPEHAAKAGELVSRKP